MSKRYGVLGGGNEFIICILTNIELFLGNINCQERLTFHVDVIPLALLISSGYGEPSLFQCKRDLFSFFSD